METDPDITTPLYITGLVLGAALLATCQMIDVCAGCRERAARKRWPSLKPWAVRLRFGAEPALPGGGGDGVTLLSPGFYLGRVLTTEPLSVLPLTVAWLAALVHEWNVALWATGGGVAWRVFYDGVFGLAQVPSPLRVRTLGLKVLFLIGAGAWVGSLLYFAWYLLWGVLFLVAMGAAGGAGQPRSTYRRRRW
jgi:hypothetical protein